MSEIPSVNTSVASMLNVRPATIDDILTIQHIASITWPVAYASILSPRQMSYMLNKMYSQQELAKQMTAGGHQFFIAEQNGEPIGFAGVSAVEYSFPPHPNMSLRKRHPWKLHKLYVLPSVQKSGAGKALIQTVLDTVHSNDGNYLILNVNRNNPAYNYYLKNGFEVLETGDFDIGSGFFMNDYVMGKMV
jgi:GNAT superfamily N-acetyltransferase